MTKRPYYYYFFIFFSRQKIKSHCDEGLTCDERTDSGFYSRLFLIKTVNDRRHESQHVPPSPPTVLLCSIFVFWRGMDFHSLFRVGQQQQQQHQQRNQQKQTQLRQRNSFVINERQLIIIISNNQSSVLFIVTKEKLSFLCGI
jgi:hypothetical protein